MNVIARLELELAYFKATVEHFIHYSMGESKVLQYFRNMGHNWAAPNRFTDIANVTTKLNCEMPSSPDTHQICV